MPIYGKHIYIVRRDGEVMHEDSFLDQGEDFIDLNEYAQAVAKYTLDIDAMPVKLANDEEGLLTFIYDVHVGKKVKPFWME